MKANYHEESIVQNLNDAGCDKEIIDAFIKNLQSKNLEIAIQQLQKHRCSLLDNLHKYQKKIDCLDYLIFMMKKTNKNIQN